MRLIIVHCSASSEARIHLSRLRFWFAANLRWPRGSRNAPLLNSSIRSSLTHGRYVSPLIVEVALRALTSACVRPLGSPGPRSSGPAGAAPPPARSGTGETLGDGVGDGVNLPPPLTSSASSFSATWSDLSAFVRSVWLSGWSRTAAMYCDAACLKRRSAVSNRPAKNSTSANLSNRSPSASRVRYAGGSAAGADGAGAAAAAAVGRRGPGDPCGDPIGDPTGDGSLIAGTNVRARAMYWLAVTAYAAASARGVPWVRAILRSRVAASR
mmetsp:Transcript_34329/g.103537  ORF Transcript_34329/g.103537 Transcript_34329/m.103537 type:complete len:269 (-) Transcript_34329:422-1228(-)